MARILSLTWGIILVSLVFLACQASSDGGSEDTADEPDATIQILIDGNPIEGGSAFAFGSVPLGTQKTAAVTVKNTSAALQHLAVSGVKIEGSGAANFSHTFAADANLAAGGTSAFTLACSPASLGALTASFSVKTLEMKTPKIVSLTGTGAPGTGLLVKQGETAIANGSGTYAFGTVDYGTSSGEIEFTLANSGTAAINLTGTPRVALSGTDASSFEVTAQPASGTLTAGSSLTFGARFTLASEGSKTAVVSVANDSETNPYTFTVTGSANSIRVLNEALAVVPTGGTVSYGNRAFSSGDEIQDYVFTIENFGTAPLTLTGGTDLVQLDFPGLHTNAYVITTAPSSPIIAGGSTTFTLRYTNPQYTSAGAKTVTLTIPSSAQPSPYEFAFTLNNTSASEIQVEYDEDVYDSEYIYEPLNNPSESLEMKNGWTRRFCVTNLGWGELRISSFTAMTSPWSQTFIPPGTPAYPIPVTNEELLFDLLYSSNDSTSFTFRIYSNDPDDSQFIINLSGTS